MTLECFDNSMRRNWTEDEDSAIHRIARNYGRGATISMLARSALPQRSLAVVYKRFNALGYGRKLRNRRQYERDDAFFGNRSVKAAYWAGFIAADGCVVNTTTTKLVTINLAEYDIDQLRKFKIDTQFEGPIRVKPNPGYKKSSVAAVISINGAGKWVEDLGAVYNVVPRKTKILQPPIGLTLQEELAYIIGYLDGDGSVYLTTYQGTEYLGIKFTGTYAVLSWIRDIFRRVAPPKSTDAKLTKSRSVYAYGIQGKRAMQILGILSNIDTPKMPRKWARFEERRAA